MTGPGGSFGSTSLRVGTDGHAWCSQYPGRLPILTVNAGSMAVTITPVEDREHPGPHVVAFARELAAQVARYVAECERLSAADRSPEKAGDGDQPGASAAA